MSNNIIYFKLTYKEEREMSSSGTSLSDLEKGSGGMMHHGGGNQDDDLVRKIFADVNAGGGSASMISSPNPNSTSQMTMDNYPATSHIIGKDQPTPGDFAAAINSSQPRINSAPMPMQIPPQQQGFMGGSPYTNEEQRQYVPQPAPTKNIYVQISSELKIPVIVALLFFTFSLPFINVLFAHYLPSVIKATGDLTATGLLIKSVMVGASFWVLQRVVVPLLTV